ncbi:MAG: 30S ribosomal protein S6 [Candidatus Yonathbacteria bacterium]|nr:30S ribosomal protein S6 [Candidatus Yonathbacteria bacterium]
MDHNEHTEPRVYELGYHLVPSLSAKQIPVTAKAVRAKIEQVSGKIIAEGLPVFIDLAYQIVKTIDHKNKRFDNAYFGFIKFEGTPSEIAKLEAELKGDENILRYILVKTLREDTFISKKISSSKTKEPLTFNEENLVKETETIDGKKGRIEERREEVEGGDLDKVIEDLVV